MEREEKLAAEAWPGKRYRYRRRSRRGRNLLLVWMD
jgi:hypothetical protein